MAAMHSPDVKAACIAALLAGQNISQVARQYQIARTTVSAWNKEAGLACPTVKTDLGPLVRDYLTELTITLKEQAIAFRDPEWLAKQNASEVAILHGVMCDKGIRLLEAIDQNPEPGV